MGRHDRWARFHEARRITAVEMLQDEVVKHFAAELAGWPLSTGVWHDERLRERFAPVLDEDCPRPGLAIYRGALQLATWEMEREFEAIDEFYRNDRAAELSSDPRERLALVFLHRWLTDSLLELLEVVERLKRPHLVDCLRRVAIRLNAPLN